MKKAIVFLAAVKLLSLTSCTLKDIEVNPKPDEETTAAPGVSPEYDEEKYTVTTITHDENSDEAAIPDAAESDVIFPLGEKIKIDTTSIRCKEKTANQGTMYMTITDAKAYKCVKDSGLPIDKIYSGSAFIEEGTAWSEYPIITLHIKIENADAVSASFKYQSAYGDHEPYKEYDFDINYFLNIVDIEHTWSDPANNFYRYGDIHYFSEYGQHRSGEFAFELKPGETKEFDVGCIPKNYDDYEFLTWDTFDPTKLYATVSHLRPGTSLIDLGITKWEEPVMAKES